LIAARDRNNIDGDPVNPCEIDARDHSGWTPLHYASANGHAEVVDMLLQGREEATRGQVGAWFETETVDDEIKYDPGGKTPLTLACATSAVSHLGPDRKGVTSQNRERPTGDVENLLRNWEVMLMDDDGDGDLTAEEVMEFVQKTESKFGARPFLIAKEQARKKAEQDEMLARVRGGDGRGLRSGDTGSQYSRSLGGTRELGGTGGGRVGEHSHMGATEGRVTWAQTQKWDEYGGTATSSEFR